MNLWTQWRLTGEIDSLSSMNYSQVESQHQRRPVTAVLGRSAPIEPLTAIVSPVMDRDAVVEYVYHE